MSANRPWCQYQRWGQLWQLRLRWLTATRSPGGLIVWLAVGGRKPLAHLPRWRRRLCHLPAVRWRLL